MGRGGDPRRRLRRLERVDVGNFTLLAAASVYNTDDDNVDYAYAASGSALHDPTGLSLTLSTGGQKLDEGDDPTNVYAKIGWDTEFWPLGPTGFGVDYTKGENISSEGAEGNSYGIAAVQRIEQYGIDLYSQFAGTASTTPATPT